MIHNTAVLTLSEGWRKQSSALKICVGGNKEKAMKIAVQSPNGTSVHNETTQNTLLYGIQNIF